MTSGLEAKQRIRGTFLKAALGHLVGQLQVHLQVLASSLTLRSYHKISCFKKNLEFSSWGRKFSGAQLRPFLSMLAGNVPFAVGSETAGSITYPSSRTGITGLRPTFGMVGRSWTMSLSESLVSVFNYVHEDFCLHRFLLHWIILLVCLH